MSEPTQLARSERYPLPLSASEGAAADFLTSGALFVQVAMPGMTAAEEKPLRRGKLRAGVHIEQPAIT